MAKLTLIEGGNTRRFNLSTGKATFGSGASAALRLTSDDIAELHGELEFTDDGIVVRPAKGVMPLTVTGVPIKGERILKDGDVVSIGGAKLSVEYDANEGPAAAAPSRTAGARGSGGAVRGAGGSSKVAPRTSNRGAGGRGAGRARTDEDDGERAGRRERRPARKSDPTALFIAIGVALVLGGLGYALLSKTSKGLSGGNFSYKTSYNRAMAAKADDTLGARTLFKKMLTEDLSPQQKAQVEAELKGLNATLANVDLAIYNESGKKFFDVRLMSFAQKSPVISDRAYARVFLKRAKWFKAKYPEYNAADMKALDIYIGKARRVAEPTESTTRSDLRVEVDLLLNMKPKRIATAYESVDAYVNELGGLGSANNVADQFRAELAQAEKDMFDERMQLAADSYFKGPKEQAKAKFDPKMSIRDYLYVIAYCVEPEHREAATQKLLEIDEMTPEYLADVYKLGKPEMWEHLATHPSMRAYLKKNGIL